MTRIAPRWGCHFLIAALAATGAGLSCLAAPVPDYDVVVEIRNTTPEKKTRWPVVTPAGVARRAQRVPGGRIPVRPGGPVTLALCFFVLAAFLLVSIWNDREET